MVSKATGKARRKPDMIMRVVRAYGRDVWHIADLDEPDVCVCGAKLGTVVERGYEVPKGELVCLNCLRRITHALGGRYDFVVRFPVVKSGLTDGRA